MKYAHRLFALLVVAIACTFVHADHHNESVELAGVWHAEASSGDSSRKVTWTFEKDGDKLKGTSLDHQSDEERKLDRITVKGKKVTLEIDVEQDGNKGMIRVEAKETAPGKLEGTFEVVGDDGTEYMSGDVTAAKEVSFAGVWDAISTLPDGQEMESQMKLDGSNAKMKGVLEGDSGKIEIDMVKVKDKSVHLEFEFEMQGNPIDIVIKAEAKTSDKLEGKWIASGDDGNELAQGDWSAVRKPKSLAGTWSVVAVVPDSADYTGTLMLKENGGGFAGTTTGSDGEAKDLTTVKVDEEEVVFSVPFEQDGVSGIVTVTATQKGEDSLVGEWVMTSDGQEVASDSWKATRTK